MASGAPDGQLILSHSFVASESITAVNWAASSALAGGSNATYTFRTVPSGVIEQHKRFLITSDEDEAIHRVVLSRHSDGWVFADETFTRQAIIDLFGIDFNAADVIDVTVYNNHTSTITFRGMAWWITRTV